MPSMLYPSYEYGVSSQYQRPASPIIGAGPLHYFHSSISRLRSVFVYYELFALINMDPVSHEG